MKAEKSSMLDVEELTFYLFNLIEKFYTAKSRKSVYNMTEETIENLVSCDRCSIFYFNEKERTLDLKMGTNLEKGDISLSVQKGVIGFCWRSSNSLIVNTPQDHPEFFSEIDERSNYQTQNLMCAIIHSPERPIGVIETLNSKKGAFTKQNLECLKLIGLILGIGLEKFNRSSIGETESNLLSFEENKFEFSDLNVKKQKELLERALISVALNKCSGNKTKAAELLGLSGEGLRKALIRNKAA